MARLWRLIHTGIHTAAENMAIDHILLDACYNGTGANTLRFYRWSPSAVSIGRFQHIHDEVDVEACQAQEVDIVRRISSGGAVYHDFEGELTYSIICRTDEAGIPSDVVTSYQHICQGLLKGLRQLGVHAQFSSGSERFCPNLFVNGRKISGNAQSRRGNTVLQHGTILRQIDLEQMFSLLKISKTRASHTIIEHAASRLTSLQQELGEVLSFEEMEDVFLAGFTEALTARFYEEALTPGELNSASDVARKWYSTPEWTFNRGLTH